MGDRREAAEAVPDAHGDIVPVSVIKDDVGLAVAVQVYGDVLTERSPMWEITHERDKRAVGRRCESAVPVALHEYDGKEHGPRVNAREDIELAISIKVSDIKSGDLSASTR